VRDAPSRVIIGELFRRGAAVVACNPVAMAEMKRIFGGKPCIDYAENATDTREGADALVIVAERKEFRC
jgi:UDPglucose 6-dehydrogenase